MAASIKAGYGTANDFQVIGDVLGHDIPQDVRNGATGNATGIMQAHYEDLLGVAALALGTTVEKITATCNKAGSRVYLSAPRTVGTGTSRKAGTVAPTPAPVDPYDAFIADYDSRVATIMGAARCSIEQAQAIVNAGMPADAVTLVQVAQAQVTDAQAQVRAAEDALVVAQAALVVALQERTDVLASLA